MIQFAAAAMDQVQVSDITNVAQKLEEEGYSHFTCLVETERARTDEVGKAIGRLNTEGTKLTECAQVLGLGTEGKPTLILDGWLYKPFVDKANTLLASISQMPGVLRNPDGSHRIQMYIAGKIYCYRSVTGTTNE